MSGTFLFRPLCWVFGHLWEMAGSWPIAAVWRCDRCGQVETIMPEEW